MRLPSLVRREWHIVYQFPLAVGLITALNLAVTVWWDWSGVEGVFAFALNTAWMLLLTVVTVVVLGVVGLPLRFIYRLNDWWRRRWWLALCGILFGLIMCVSAFYIGAEDLCVEEEPMLAVPNQALSMGGLWLIGFCTLHFYIPFEKIIRAIYGKNHQRKRTFS